MSRVSLTSQQLNKLLSENTASRAAKDRAARALMSEQDKEIFAIADYVSLVMRDIRNVPRYSALPSSGWREDGRWGMYERLYKFCRENEIDPKIWIDAQTYFVRKVLSVADDNVYISAMTSVRERALEIFDEYTKSHELDIVYFGAAYDRERRESNFKIRRANELELGFNVVTGRVDDVSLMKLWKEAADAWHERMENSVKRSIRRIGENRGKHLSYSMEFANVNRLIIPFFPSGRMWVRKEDSELVARLSSYYLLEKSALFPELRDYWLESEKRCGIPHKILGWMSATPALIARYGARGIDMNSLYALPSLPLPDELKGV